MVKTGAQLKANPEIIRMLSSASGTLWSAAHEDGSSNRINGDAVMEAATYSTSLGILSAVFQGIRKAFRNRGKTKEDLAAEKEAAGINKSCGALEAMLLDYIRSAQEGAIEDDDLDDLMDMLEEMQGYAQTGKLKVPGKKGLADICGSIADYTAAITGKQAASPAGTADMQAADLFRSIREQLIMQKEWMSKKN